MSDNQRRAVCRILFLLVCILPTSAIGYWICHPQTARGWQRTIQAQLGVTTEIGWIETPGPYVTILGDLRFLDLDGSTLCKTVTARIEFGGDYNQVVISNQVNGLTNEGLDYLVQTINQHVIRKRSADKRWFVVLEKNLTIEKSSTARPQQPESQADVFDGLRERLRELDPEAVLTLTDLTIEVGPTQSPQANGAYATTKFKVVDALSNQTSESIVECQMSRTDQDGSVMYFDTNDVRLPCWLLANQRFDLSSKLGSTATFRGELRFEPTPLDPTLEMAGKFENLSLVSSLPGVGQNNASIQLNHCKYENGELAIWDAVLLTDLDSRPRKIDPKHLFTIARQLDIAGAIRQTWMGPLQSAQRESDPSHR